MLLLYTSCTTSRRGFTLVELSIVLVILGLLVGGVLSGQSLIRAAELRSIVTDSRKYTTAVHAFRDKYFALPGDMSNATSFWGAADSTPATCITTASTDAKTCNGTGDGKIDYDNNFPNNWEGFRAWQHLANAGLIEGRFDGTTHDANPLLSLYFRGVNVPATRVSNGVWGLWYLPGRATITWAPVNAGHYLGVGGTAGAAPNRWHNPLFKPEEAWNIDTKLDDAMPFTGKVNAIAGGYAPNCITNETTTGTYVLSYPSIACLLIVSAL